MAFELLERIFNPAILYRSSGIMLENITLDSEEQLFLFTDEEVDSKHKNLAKCLDKLEAKFGKNVVKTGFTTKGKVE